MTNAPTLCCRRNLQPNNWRPFKPRPKDHLGVGHRVAESLAFFFFAFLVEVLVHGLRGFRDWLRLSCGEMKYSWFPRFPAPPPLAPPSQGGERRSRRPCSLRSGGRIAVSFQNAFGHNRLVDLVRSVVNAGRSFLPVKP